MDDQLTVCVVLDPHYGHRIGALVQSAPVWAVDTPDNRTAWEKAKPLHGNSSLFKALDSQTRTLALDRVLPDIEDHFGPYSTDKPYSRLRVIGLELTEDLAYSLLERGLSDFVSLENGFEASVIRKRSD